MTETIRVGRLAGVRVGLHWSVVGIVLLVVIGLAGYQLPVVFPGYPVVAYWLAGLGAAVLFVCSLLAHEMAHAIVARRNGVQVEGITLWLLGGVARLRGEARTPGAELRIALVGPVTSVVVGVVLAGVAWLAAVAGAGTLTVGVLVYLAVVNAVLAVFNMVPAAPLDGGRVLRAALWAWRGDRFRAAVWAARAGRGFGFLLIVLGVVRLLTRDTGGLWWMLLGWFVVNVAGAEEQQARAGAALAGIRVRDVMSERLDIADGRWTVEDFLRGVAAAVRPHSAYPLLDEAGRVRGLVTLKRLRAVPPERRSTTSLQQVACPPDEMAWAEPDEPLATVLPRMAQCTDGRVVVGQAGRAVGIVSPSDVSRAAGRVGFGVGLAGGADLAQETPAPPPDWWYPGGRPVAGPPPSPGSGPPPVGPGAPGPGGQQGE